MDKFTKVIGAIVLAFAAIFGLSLLLAFPTKWLINYIFTDEFLLLTFGITKISVWKALAVNMLFTTLFKSTITKN